MTEVLFFELGRRLAFAPDCAARNVHLIAGGGGLPADVGTYERLVVLFNGANDGEDEWARTVWSACRAKGLNTTYWIPDERGKWQRKA